MLRIRLSNRRRAVLSWAMYDWANSAFATVVIAGVFPILYRDYWAASLADDKITLGLALSNSSASVLLIVVALLLGPVADKSNRRKRFLLFSAAAGAFATALLSAVPAGDHLAVLLVYLAAVFFFMLANVFYDSLLLHMDCDNDYDSVSSLGYALGYLGGGLLYAAVAFLIVNAERFGFSGTHAAMKTGFLASAVWWILFSIPLLLYVREISHSRERREALTGRLSDTVRLLKQHPHAAWFLLAYWLYIDGVDTIIRMAVNYGQTLGFSAIHLMMALLMVQFVGFPATLLYGKMARHIGAKNSVLLGIAVYILVCIFAALLESIVGFFVLAFVIGLVQGGIQAESRSLFASLTPAQHAARFFGIYNFFGRFAVILGPILLSLTGSLSGNIRWGMLSLIVLFIAGGWLLCRLPIGQAGSSSSA